MIVISGYSFEGPYEIGDEMLDRAAVYVILDVRNNVIDVGQSGETRTRLSNHERKSCWNRHEGKWFGVRWMLSDRYSREDRERLEHEIRSRENPPCGEI